jgi:hypothetical protein
LSERFKLPACSLVWHSERVVLAGEWKKNSTYHHFADYGILEIIDDAGKPVR